MNSPFKFLDAYQKEDLDIFFGREKETEALYQALSGVKHLLVYGASGTGKTSLIECGLRNQFSDADWFALSIRKRNNINESVLHAINEALSEKIEGIDDFGQAVESLFAERYQPIYLLFDQFEELLILGEKQEKEEFFERLNRLIRHKVPCRVMLIMREEFIGHLSEFEHLCPSIFQHRFRLEKMNKGNVKEVIEKTLTAPKYQNSFEINDSEALIEAILACLPDEKKEIELAHVQVFLDQLWERAYAQTTSGKPILMPALVKENDRLESVLNNFLTKQLADLDQSYGKNVALELLAVMISEKHTKLQVEESAIAKDLTQKQVNPQKPLKELLKDLEKRRTLRTLKANEQTQYEISHDLLARAVGQNLTEEMKMREKAQDIYKVLLEKQGYYSQEDLDLVCPYQSYWAFPVDLEKRIIQSETHLVEQKEKELKEAKDRAEKERNLSRRAYYVATVALLIAVLAGVFYFQAEEAKVATEKQKQIADENLQKAKKLINAFYFAYDRFALAFKDNKFYFIDKNGDKVEKLGEWNKAEQFSENRNSFTKVWKENKEYYLDTLGNSYRVAYKIEDLSSEIKALDLSGTKLNSFPNEVLKYTQLEVLILNGGYLNKNNFKTLPAAISNLFNLKVLQLSSCGLNALPAQIGELKNLTWLDLSSNELTILPAQIWELKSLTYLNLSSNQLISLSTQIGELKNLTTLDLINNQLSTLPTQIGELKNLTFLRLSENKLTALPAQIGELKNLMTLHLMYNQLTALPAQIGELKSLTTLYLSENQFSSFPSKIAELKNLTTLHLMYNQLTDLPAQIGEFKNLTSLYLSGNLLTTMPVQVRELKNLTTLHLSKNQFSSLPAQIGELKNLTYLDLSGNLLTKLPFQIRELKNLTTLDLGVNQLSSLPAQIGELKNLTSLDLSYNQLSTLPIQIEGLKNLEYLNLYDNKLSKEEEKKIKKLLPNCEVNFSMMPRR